MKGDTVGQYHFCIGLIAVIWLVHIVHVLLGPELRVLALRPCELESVYTVFTMHFLHWNFGHLIANTIPLLVLGLFVSTLGKAKWVTVMIVLLCGVSVWLFGRNALHAGASGLVMGYWGFLLSNAFWQRNLKSIFIAAITLITYGGLVFSLFDFRPTVSFEGHAFGLLAGVLSAWLLKTTKKIKRSKKE